MASPQRVPGPRAQPLHARAMDDLSFIRRTMERATPFTAVPGWGGVTMGLVALVAAAVGSRAETAVAWVACWVTAAVVALLIGGWAMPSWLRWTKSDAANASCTNCAWASACPPASSATRR